MHITSLPSVYGIGDLGQGAYQFADFLADTGQTYWQILPVNPTSTAYGNSPYSSQSAFAGNTLLISPDLLREKRLITEEEINGMLPVMPDETVDYDRATLFKEKIMSSAFGRFRSEENAEVEHDYSRFCKQNSVWLEDYALFSVLREEHGNSAWNTWEQGLRDRDQEKLEKTRNKFAERIMYVKFTQYLFYSQWKELKNYCSSLGIRIIGDVPIYPNFDSCDVWANQQLFKLDKKKRPRFVAGVPPDYYSSTGQLWGNPVYDWDVLKKTGYRWWIDRLAHNFRLVDIVRIDHFRGFVACWEVPAGHKTAVEGSWVDVPAKDFFNTLKRHFKPLPVLAEDLGIITPDVRDVMEHYAFPGMKVLLFAFGDDFPDGDYLPHNYSRNCVVYTGTHDNNTVRGWFRQEADDEQKNRLSGYAGADVDEDTVSWHMIRLAMLSVADTAVIPMQDILSLDEYAKMNVPATTSGNWMWRMNGGFPDRDTAEKLREITIIYGRSRTD